MKNRKIISTILALSLLVSTVMTPITSFAKYVPVGDGTYVDDGLGDDVVEENSNTTSIWGSITNYFNGNSSQDATALTKETVVTPDATPVYQDTDDRYEKQTIQTSNNSGAFQDTDDRYEKQTVQTSNNGGTFQDIDDRGNAQYLTTTNNIEYQDTSAEDRAQEAAFNNEMYREQQIETSALLNPDLNVSAMTSEQIGK